jgi:hypothetical protein
MTNDEIPQHTLQIKKLCFNNQCYPVKGCVYLRVRRSFKKQKIMKSSILFLFLIGLSGTLFGQKNNCQSLHAGTFKAISKNRGITIIKRTNKLQVE